MRELFRALGEACQKGEAAVLVTVVASSGSTPRDAGARMLVTRKGRIFGTVGGGAVEYKSEQMALEVLQSGDSCVEVYRLHKNEVQDLGMICGGDVQVYFQYIPAGDADLLALVLKIETLYQQREPFWLISDITPGQKGAMGVYGKHSGLMGAEIPDEVLAGLQNKPLQIKANGRAFYCERLMQAGTVYIFGGGHVAQALVPALAAVDFRCVVLEDREKFCRRELFPGVEETVLIDNARIADFIAVTRDDYVAIMTRGHKDDETVLAQVLKTPACYIGMIGSRRKSAGVFAGLRKIGFTDEDLSRITTPIGLDIQAQTPAEIAVSITAQLIHKRAGRNLKGE